MICGIAMIKAPPDLNGSAGRASESATSI
ncbi:hypothetical protein BURKHO8Y_70033 [Burkholderia sp. 8Y]|nr:hypothetical protein BURKHO8Y_70033 [Burkholderia sp. 8Y]